METKKLKCDHHGETDAYIICIHVLSGIPAEEIELSEESDGGIGFACCKECCEKLDEVRGTGKTQEYTIKNFKPVCRGCAVSRGCLPWREGDPKPEILEPSLLNAEKCHHDNPEFEIPPLMCRDNLSLGQQVKLAWVAADDRGERMWVEILSRRVDHKYIGVLINTPIVFKDCLRYGQQVIFGAENIIDLG